MSQVLPCIFFLHTFPHCPSIPPLWIWRMEPCSPELSPARAESPGDEFSKRMVAMIQSTLQTIDVQEMFKTVFQDAVAEILKTLFQSLRRRVFEIDAQIKTAVERLESATESLPALHPKSMLLLAVLRCRDPPQGRLGRRASQSCWVAHSEGCPTGPRLVSRRVEHRRCTRLQLLGGTRQQRGGPLRTQHGSMDWQWQREATATRHHRLATPRRRLAWTAETPWLVQASLSAEVR